MLRYLSKSRNVHLFLVALDLIRTKYFIYTMNIFVSNISRSATNFQLNKLFSEYGEVQSAKIVIDKITEESRGFGFIEMKELSAAQKAIDSLNGTLFLGKTINVSEARPREERSKANPTGRY